MHFTLLLMLVTVERKPLPIDMNESIMDFIMAVSLLCSSALRESTEELDITELLEERTLETDDDCMLEDDFATEDELLGAGFGTLGAATGAVFSTAFAGFAQTPGTTPLSSDVQRCPPVQSLGE